MGPDVLREVVLVLNNARHEEPAAGASGDLDRFFYAFVVMDAAEEEEVVAAFRAKREALDVYTVVDSRDIVEFGAAVRFADRDVVRPAVVSPVDGQDAVGRRTLD